ncbi:hypothetical protein NQ318_014309 [Aromia moschata]|uniref:Uncharacterized protein n=1 Tax=Aromia moschata TaxID=1265417 RepID=A0AAV8Z122_9CUCU|nr:hypothetical protein NQ318_014309 [Aromia moschata]
MDNKSETLQAEFGRGGGPGKNRGDPIKDSYDVPDQRIADHPVHSVYIVEENPKLSVRKRSAQIDISKTHIQRILAENKFKAFKPKIIHTLEVGDDARRLDFCLEIGARLTVDMNFHKKYVCNFSAGWETTWACVMTISTPAAALTGVPLLFHWHSSETKAVLFPSLLKGIQVVSQSALDLQKCSAAMVVGCIKGWWQSWQAELPL